MTAPLKVQNETDHDGRAVAGIVRWVFRELDLDGRGVVVKVKHHGGSHAYQGRFYGSPHRSYGYIWNASRGDYVEVAPKMPRGYDRLIVCRIAKGGYPLETHVYDRRDSPGTWVVADWREALVSITAHEAMHLRKVLTKARGKRGRMNEVETEWAAYRLWRRWRER